MKRRIKFLFHILLTVFIVCTLLFLFEWWQLPLKYYKPEGATRQQLVAIATVNRYNKWCSKRKKVSAKMDQILKSISILYRKSHIWLNNSCAQFGLTSPQAMVILLVCDFSTLTQDEITKRLNLDKSVVAKTVNKLIQSDFMVRTTNRKDKRTYDIMPTSKAWEVYPFIKSQVRDCFEQITRQMTEEERAVFERLLAIAAQSALEMDE